MIRDGGTLRTTEIRTRERFADRWATNAYRPFATAGQLATAIRAKNATAPLGSLESTTLTPKQIRSPAFNNIVSMDGFVDAPLPDLAPDLVRTLLAETTFVSTYGTAWKASGTAKAFGPTGPAAGLSVVPARFDTGVLEVRETTCEKCHNQGGYFVGDLVPDAVLYGDIWGVDRIFSFYVFDPSRVDASGNENRVARPLLLQAGIIAQYNEARHPTSRYTFYRTPR